MKGTQFLKWFILMLFLLLQLACSGGGGDDGDVVGTGEKPKNDEVVKGTAAVGKPLQCNVTLKDADGKTKTTSTKSDGKFEIDVKGLKPPFLLKAEDTDKTIKLFSIAHAKGITNIHPFSDMVARNWFRVHTRNIEYEFDHDGAINNPPPKDQVDNIVLALKNLLIQVFAQFSVESNFDLLHSAFDANQQGFDSLLDHIAVKIKQGKITIKLTAPDIEFGFETVVILDLDLGEDLTLPDNQAPTTPNGLAAIAASTTNVVLVWNSSQDNIGVAGYNIYRDDAPDQVLATTPFPMYSDTGLTPGGTYCYAVEAFDGAGNTSTRTNIMDTCVTTQEDTADPLTPGDLSATTMSASEIALIWDPSQSTDIIGYDIYRGPSGAVDTKIATVVASSYQDFNLDASTQYCYRVQAFNAAGKRSADNVNGEVCATTDAPDTAPPVSMANPVGGTYSTSQSVTLSCNDSGGSGCAAIYYTLDGSDPDLLSSQYSNAIDIAQNTTLIFFAVDYAGNAEAVHTENYIIDSTAPMSSATPAQGTYNAAQSVTLSCDDGNGSGCAAIYYTTDGTDPTTGSAQYSTPIAIDADTTLMYFAMDNAGNAESVHTEVYTIDTLAPVSSANPGEGTYSSTQSVILSCDDGSGTGCAVIYYTTDGTDPTTGSAQYSNPIDIGTTTTLKFFAVDNAGNSEGINSQVYTFGTETIAPLTSASPGTGAYNAPQSVTLTCTDSGGSGCTVIYYTTDGTDPTTGSAQYSTPFDISTDTTLKFFAVDNAGNAEIIRTETYTIDTVAPVSSANPGGGTYNTAQSVTLSCDDGTGSGCAAIYYTTDGTVPTTGSALYTSPIDISVDTTLMFFAVDNAGNQEVFNTESYVINISLLEVDVTATPDPVVPGGRVFYAITVSNVSQQPVTNVGVQMQVPTGLDFHGTQDAEPNPTLCGGNGICDGGEAPAWDLTTLAAGESRTINVNANVAGTLLNGTLLSASFQVTATELTNAINLDKSVEVNDSPSVQLVMGASTDAVRPGDTFSYTVDVGNISGTQITGTQIRTTLPAGVSVTEPIADNGTVDGITGEVVWDIDPMDVGTNFHREVQVTVDTGVAGAILTARSELTHDGGLVMDMSAEHTVTVSGISVPLNINVAATPDPVVSGDKVTYNITVNNASSQPVNNVNMIYRVPAGIGFNASGRAEPNPTGCGGNGICDVLEEATWSLGDLAAKESRTITINADIVASPFDGTLISAPIRITADQLRNTVNLRKTVAVYSTPSAQLALGASTDAVVPGDTFTYTVDVGNISGADLTGTQLRVSLPDGVSWSNISDSGFEDNGDIVWPLNTVAVNSVLQREVSVSVNGSAGDILAARAELIHDGGLEVDLSAEHAVTVVESALPLKVEVTTSANPVVSGETETYNITLSNTSAQPVDNVKLIYRVPDGIQFNAGMQAEPNPNSGCGGNGYCDAGEEATWDNNIGTLGTLAAKESRTITINASVLGGLLDGRLISTELRVTATQLADTIHLLKTVGVYNSPSAQLVMGASTDAVRPGDDFTFTVDVGNISGAQLTGAQLRTRLPVNVTASGTIADGGSVDPVTGEIVWDINPMVVGTAIHREVSVTVNTVAGDILTAHTELTHDNGLEMDLSAEHSVTVAGATAPLIIDVSATPNPVIQNGQVNYTITVSNASSQPVNNVNVMYRVPKHIQFNAASQVEPNPNAGCGGNGYCDVLEEVTWALGTLVAKESRTITINADVIGNPLDGTLISAPIRVTATEIQDTINLTKTVEVYSVPPARLVLGASTDAVLPGDTFTYTVDVGNDSGADLTGAQLRLSLPAGVTEVGASTPGGEVVWNLGTVAVNSVLRREVSVTVTGSAGDILAARAQLLHDGDREIDLSAEHAVTVVQSVQPLTVDVTTSANPVVSGETVTYTITVNNTSAQPVDNVQVIYRVPDGIQFHAANHAEPNPDAGCGGNGYCDVTEEATWNNSMGTLAAKESRTITINASVLSGLLGGRLISATVRVDATQLTDTINLVKTVGVYNSPLAQLTMSAFTNPAVATDPSFPTDAAQPGDSIKFTVDVGNISATDITGAQLRTSLPEGVTIAGPIADGGTVDAVTGEIVWTIDVAAAANVHREVPVTVNTGTAGAILTARSWLSHAGGVEEDLSSEYSLTVPGTSQRLTVSVSAAPNPVAASGTLTYTIEVSNTSAQPVNLVSVKYWVPVGIQFHATNNVVVSNGATTTGCGGNGYCDAGEEATWALGTMAASTTETITITVPAVNLLDGNLVNALMRVTATELTDNISLLSTVPVSTN